MAIRILRNETGNCINFVGSTQPAYWNGCLSARVNEEDDQRIDVINDIRTTDPENPIYEFYAVPYTDFRDAENNSFASAQETADYITANGNVLGGGTGPIQATANTTLDFQRDATNTTILSDDGRNAPVNALKAFLGTNDLISIAENALGANNAVIYEGLYPDNITIAGSDPSTTAAGTVNALNALFTVQPLGAGGSVDLPTYPTSNAVSISSTKQEGIDPVGTPIYTTGSDTTSGHGARVWSTGTDYIDDLGEYFTVRIQDHGRFILGIYDLDDATQVAALSNDTGNGHSGLMWGNAFYDYGDYIAPWSMFGAQSSHQAGPGWLGSDQTKWFRYNTALQEDILDGTGALFKIGITSEGRIAVSYYDIGRSNDWIETARSGYVLPEGRYGLVVKLWDGTVKLQGEPSIYKQEETAPALNYRYIESPDGVFYYPLFATREEADYVSQNANTFFGTGYINDANTNSDGYYSHSHIFVDEPTNSTWYMPDNYQFHSANSAPTSNSTVNYSSIGTESDDLYAPAALNLPDLTFNENVTVNQQILPQDSTALIQDTPSFQAALALVGLSYNPLTLSIEGTTSYVPEDTTSTITVVRSNAYGTTTQTFDITITDNASLGDLADFTETAGNMVQPNRIILTHDALLQYDTTLAQGEEMTFSFSSGNIPPTMGILSTLGQTNLNAFDPATDVLGASSTYNYAETNKWALRFVLFGGDVGSSVTKHNLVGWSDNTTITGSEGTNNDIEFKLEYSSVDGLMRLYRGDVLLKTSASAFTGAQTITFAGFDDQAQSDLYIPTNLAITNSSYGTTQPPSGFVNPLLAGQMATSTLMGEAPDEDAAVQLTQQLRINHRMIFPQTWVEANILPHIHGDGEDVYIGVPVSGVSWTDVGGADFDVRAKLSGQDTNSHRSLLDATSAANDDSVLVNSITDAFYDYALEWDGTDLHIIACNIGDINTQPAINAGGTFSRKVTEASYAGGPNYLDVAFGVDNGGQLNLTTSGINMIRTPFGINDILVGEASNGHGRYAQQPAASVFDSAPSGHAPEPAMAYDAISTLNAGTTYRFIFHPSMETDDTIEFRLASDNTTVYTTGITTFGSGDPRSDSAYKGIEFAVPTDAPPLTMYYYNSHGGGAYDLGNAISISGSTYVEPVTGITQEGPAANQTGTNIFDSNDHGWLSIDEQLGAGERLVLSGAFLSDVADAMGDNTVLNFGIKDTSWANTISGYNTGFEGGIRFTMIRYSSTDIQMYMYKGESPTAAGSTLYTTVAGLTSYNAFLEVTSTGNNVRGGVALTSTNDATSDAYADWASTTKIQSGDQGYGITSIDVVVQGFALSGTDTTDAADIDWTALSEISIPTPAATLTTPWTKALDFSGSSERAQQVAPASTTSPIRMSDLGATASAGSAGNTSNDTNARPWATAVVFSSDNNSSNQHIWNQGEGAGSTDDNIYLRVTAARELFFGWGRDGALNECSLGTLASGSGHWYGIYIAHNGRRLNATEASNASTLATCFDIYGVNLSTGVVGSQISTGANWSTNGGRMDRSVLGDFTIGGRGSNRNFHGKVASMVVTTLPRNVAMPTNSEISMMVRDPLQWLTDYKVGNPWRMAHDGFTNTTGNGGGFTTGSVNTSRATQVWLMGDGTGDAYAKIRNQVLVDDQNVTPLNMVSMLSNDIQTVTISGLT